MYALQPSRRRGLGGIASGAAAGSILPGIGTLLGGGIGLLTDLNKIGSLFGLNSSDPRGDQERVARINYAFTLAMQGDPTPQSSTSPLTNLTDGHSQPMSGAAYLEYIATNNHGRPDTSDGGAVYGSQIAYRYAQTKWGEFQARHAAGVVGSGLIGQSDIPSQIVGGLRRVAQSPVLLIGGALALYLLTRKRGR